MKSSNLLKILTIIGIVLFNFKTYAGVPEDGTIIVFQTEQQVQFKVQDQNLNTIKDVLYFKIDASGTIVHLRADACGVDYCTYSINKAGLQAGIYQIHVYVYGYSEPISESFVLE